MRREEESVYQPAKWLVSATRDLELIASCLSNLMAGVKLRRRLEPRTWFFVHFGAQMAAAFLCPEKRDR